MEEAHGLRDAPPPLEGSWQDRIRAAPVTAGAAAIAALVSVAWWGAAWTKFADHEAVRKLVWRSAFEVWNGAWWALLTSVFLHGEVIHLGFNVFWMIRLVAEVERRTGWRFWLLFFVVTSTFASFAELAVSDDVGIGLSGFAYAAFAFAWRRSKTDPAWRGILGEWDTALWIGWAFVCWGLTAANQWNVANAAHAGGFAVGLLWAFVTEPRRGRIVLRTAAACLVVGAPAAVVVWGIPWSGSRHFARAWSAHVGHDRLTAIREYRRARELGFDAATCFDNIGTLELWEGNRAAYESAMQELTALDADAGRKTRTRLEASSAWSVLCAREALELRDAKAALPHLVRARDLDVDRAWCDENIAWAHLALEHEDDYEAAMRDLEKTDPARYERALKHFGRTRPAPR